MKITISGSNDISVIQETPININIIEASLPNIQIGLPGVQGPAGPVGPQGPAGDVGPAGPAGATDHLLLSNIGTRTHAQLETDIADKVTANTAITGSTKTKITYDAKGLVTSGADATTADIADSANKRYVTDAQQTVLGNTSGINTGDQNLAGLVPYTGATADVNLGTNSLRADQIKSETANVVVLDTDSRKLYNSAAVETLDFNTKNLVGNWTGSGSITANTSLRAKADIGLLDFAGLPSLNYAQMTYDAGTFYLNNPDFSPANLVIDEPTTPSHAATKMYADTKASISQSGLSVSFTGAWLYEPLFVIVPALNTFFNGVFIGYSGKWIEGFSYVEASVGFIPKITALTFNDLEGSRAAISLSTMTAATSFSFPALKFVGGGLSIASMNSLTSTSFPALKAISGVLSFSTTGVLTSISFPELEFCGSSVTFSSLTLLSSMSLPKLRTVVSGLTISGSANLNSVSLPLLKEVSGTLTISGTNVLSSLSMPELDFVSANVSISTMSTLTSLNIAKLSIVGGVFSPNTLAALTNLSAPLLVRVLGNFAPTTMASLTTFSFPSLITIGGNFAPTTMGALTSLSFPSLVSTGSFSPSGMALVTSFSFPALTTVTGSWNPTLSGLAVMSAPSLATVSGAMSHPGCTALTTISYPAMVTYSSTISATSLPLLTTVTIGTIGVLKVISGASVSFSTCALNQASVDGILALLVSLNGSGGTTLFGAGKTVTLNGGTNSTPSAAGLANKAILVSRGATVTNN